MAAKGHASLSSIAPGAAPCETGREAQEVGTPERVDPAFGP